MVIGINDKKSYKLLATRLLRNILLIHLTIQQDGTALKTTP
tara:strand:+ start:9293 stop:9415 length:123 start_codon:yes stop_codon:yes gene_type:complete